MSDPTRPGLTQSKPGLPEQPELLKVVLLTDIGVRYIIHDGLILGNIHEINRNSSRNKENNKHLTRKQLF